VDLSTGTDLAFLLGASAPTATSSDVPLWIQNIVKGNPKLPRSLLPLLTARMTRLLVCIHASCYRRILVSNNPYATRSNSLFAGHALEKFGKSLTEVEKCRNLMVCT
jgi:hypothetical protein